MGRNSKPLCIGVQPGQLEDSIIFQEALKPFADKGHVIIYEPSQFMLCDVIIGPKCRRIDSRIKLGDDSTQEESLKRQLEMMEKGERAIKYPKEKS